jgi:hypothetical protein
MSAGARSHSDAVLVPLLNAVFCLDCEVISASRCDECPACKGRSLVSLARMVGGSLFAHKLHGSSERVLFDVHISIELHQTQAKDLNATLEDLTRVIGPYLTQSRGLFHVNVQPAERDLFLHGRIEKLSRVEPHNVLPQCR